MVELKLFRQLPDGQVTLKSVLCHGILTCPSLQILWQRSNTTQTIEKYYVTYIRKVYQVTFHRLHWQKLFLTLSTRGLCLILIPSMHPFADQYAVWCEENVFLALISILKSDRKRVKDNCEWKLWTPLQEDWGRGIISVNMGSFRSRRVEGMYYLVNPKHKGWASIPEGSTLSALKSAGPKIWLHLFFLKCLNNKIFLISLHR